MVFAACPLIHSYCSQQSFPGPHGVRVQATSPRPLLLCGAATSQPSLLRSVSESPPSTSDLLSLWYRCIHTSAPAECTLAPQGCLAAWPGQTLPCRVTKASCAAGHGPFLSGTFVPKVRLVALRGQQSSTPPHTPVPLHRAPGEKFPEMLEFVWPWLLCPDESFYFCCAALGSFT